MGTLVDTLDVTALADGMTRSLQLACDPATADRNQAVVAERYTIAGMAARLAAIYRTTTAPRVLGQRVRHADR